MAKLKLFLSYRRDDLHGHAAALVGRIYDRLSAHYGGENVFMDVDTIPPGVDFVEHLTLAVEQTNVLLAVVGDRWTELMRARGDEDDFVRIEIEAALGLSIPVVPLLVGGADMPKADDLPPALQPFIRRNAVPIDSGRDFNPHITRLIADLDRYFGDQAGISASEPVPAPETAVVPDDAMFNYDLDPPDFEEDETAEPETAAETEAVMFEDDFDLPEIEEEESDEPEKATKSAAVMFEDDFDLPEVEDETDADDVANVPDIEEPNQIPEAADNFGTDRKNPRKRLFGIAAALAVGAVLLKLSLPAGNDFPDAVFPEPIANRNAKEGENFISESGIEFMWCEPGSFRMGPEISQPYQPGDEPHQVTLTKGFWIGRFEVTQQQWKEVMRNNPSRFKRSGPMAPVESVSWDDAMEFCRKLTEKERASGSLPSGWKYTLPTEAQWEYACRAGTNTSFSFGDDESMLGSYAWFNENSDEKTHPVGQKKPNSWGLYDMHGNVWEWCYDGYASYPSTEVTDPTGPKVQARVYRGGGWPPDANYCRSARRSWNYPYGRRNDLGFRPVRSAE